MNFFLGSRISGDKRRRGLCFGAFLTLLITYPVIALGFVTGNTPAPLSTHTLFGNAKAAGATLMSPGSTAAEIRSFLLPFSDSGFTDLPADAIIEKAYLFWTGSLAQDGVAGVKTMDDRVTFTVQNLATYTVTADPGACSMVTHPTEGTQFPPFFYCRADVTAQVIPHRVGGTYNGIYRVSDLAADPGHIDANGVCTETPFAWCQAKYAAWSLVLIYSSPSERLQRDIHLYDGFLLVDHQNGPNGSLGIANFNITGFLADNPPQGTLSYFAVETDAQLGLPPQDLYPPGSSEYCDVCQDYLRINGAELSGPNNPPGNLFNESLGGSSGVDLDTFEIGSLISGGDTQAAITIGSGTGSVVSPAPSHGGGELFGFGWTLLSLRRPAPNFKTTGTYKRVIPSMAGQGETLAYTVNILNAGSLPAVNTMVTDTLPPMVNYQPSSLHIDGSSCTDAADGDPCTVSGQTLTFNLGTLSHLTPDNQRQITFQATVSPAALNGQLICNRAEVVSTQTPTAHSTPAACFTVRAPELSVPTKTGLDLDGGFTEPGDIMQYTVTLGTPGSGPISGISFVDDMPPFLRLLSVTAPPGSINLSTLNGGVNGKGRVEITSIAIPAGASSATVTILAQIDSAAQLTAQGIGPGQIDGLQICNQGQVSAPFLPIGLSTDDPEAPANNDATCVSLTYAPVLSSSIKAGFDLNGGQLEPDDTIHYTIQLANTGNQPATITGIDDLPAALSGLAPITTPPGAQFTYPPAGANGTGLLTIQNLVVAPGTVATIIFDAAVSPTAPHQTGIQNCLTFSVAEKASEGRTICSTSLAVFSTPNLEGIKTVTDLDGAPFRPGDAVRYSLLVTNSGNQPATDVNVSDLVLPGLTAVVPLDGGTYDGATRLLLWSVGSLAPGDFTTLRFEAQVESPFPNGGQICNQGAISSNELTPLGTDDPATAAAADPTCITIISAPDLDGLTKSVVDLDGAPTRPGDRLSYTINIINQGSDEATSVEVRDVLSSFLTNITPLDGGSYDPGSHTISWSLPSLGVGETRPLRFEAAVITPLINDTVISNQAFATAQQIPAPGAPSDDPATSASDDPTTITVTSAPVLSGSDKAVIDLNGGVPQPGDVLTYTITLRNSGDAPARDTVVTDSVPITLTDITPLAGGVFEASARTITWPGVEVVPGSEQVLSFNAMVAAPLANGTVVCNQASASSVDLGAPVLTDDLSTAAPVDATCLTVESRPDLGGTTKIVEDLNGGEVVPGDLLRYIITLDNIGTQAATAVIVTDLVSEHLTDISPLDGGVFIPATRTITWDVAQVQAKSQHAVSFLAQVALPLDNGTQISNQASVTAAELPMPQLSDDPGTPATDDPTIITVSAAPSFTSSAKTMLDVNGALVEPGDILNYTILVVNDGTSLADQVAVTDLLDSNLNFLSAGQGGTYDAATRTLSWNSGSTPSLTQLALGASAAVTLTFSARVVDPLPNGTEVCNQGSISSEELVAPTSTDNPQTPVLGDPTCGTVSSAPDLSGASKLVVDQNGPPLRPGDLLTYSISLPNTGNAAATGLTVTDPIDPGLINIVPADGGLYNAAARTITWTSASSPALASLGAGTAATLTFTAMVTKPLDNGTMISNQATILSADLPAAVLTDDPTTPAVDDPTRVQVTAAPLITGSEKTVLDVNGGNVAPNDLLTYTITLKNSGDALARGLVITDSIDPNLTVIQVMDGGLYNAASRLITWSVPVLGLSPSGDMPLRFTAQILSPLENGTVIANQGSIQSLEGPPVLTDDPSTPSPEDPTTVTVVSRPDLSGMTKRVSGALANKKVAPGTALLYSIEIPNTGNDHAENVLVTDVIDPNLEQVVALDGGSYDPVTRRISWSLTSINVNASPILRFSAQVKADVQNGAKILNQAFAELQGLRGQIPSDDPDTAQLDDPTILSVEAIPDLEQFTKAVQDLNGGDVEPGDTLQYLLVIRNSGSAYAFNVQVLDKIPTHQLENIAPEAGGSFDPGSGVITWDGVSTPALAKLPPNEEVTLSFSAQVRRPLANGTEIANQARLSANGMAQVPSDDPSTTVLDDPTVVTVVSLPKFTNSEKRVVDLNGGLVKPGDMLEYIIRVQNNGTSNANGVILLDPIPTFTQYVANTTLLNGNRVPDASGDNPSPTAAGLLVNSPGQSKGVVEVGNDAAAEIRFRVRVALETQEGRIISNQGMIRSSITPLVVTDDPSTGVHGDPTQVVVGSGPNLSGTLKTFDPRPLEANTDDLFDIGEVIAYSVVIPNTGTAPATGVVFTDALDPDGRGAYVPGSLKLDGRPLSDGADGDPGSASDQGLQVVVGQIDPGKSALITYHVRVVRGPRIVNQGTVRCTQLQPELTDADGSDTNGDAPTVVPVAGSGNRHLRGQKTLQDLNGGNVLSGDELLYTITIFNDGTAQENVDLIDSIPVATNLLGGSVVIPVGAGQVFEPAPGGPHQRGELNISSISIPAGGSAVVLLRVILDTGLQDGISICNTALLGSDGGLDLQPTLEPACTLVGSPAGEGGVAGLVFRDMGEDNRTWEDTDQVLKGYQIHAYTLGNSNGSPIATAVSGEKGAFSLRSLPPGPYTLRVLTAKGVQMGAIGALSVSSGQSYRQNLLVDPSGVIYNSISGELIAGTQIFLNFDSTDTTAPDTLVPADLLGHGQQGQVTDDSGFYRFDLQQGRRYRLEVTPPSSLQFPSALIPATAGFAEVGPDHEVVPDDLPDPKREGAKLTHYLRFKVDSPTDAVFNNHIPIDPLSSLIRLEKRADRRRASLGDIVTYTITVENRSTRDFLSAGQHVGLEDILPRGFRFLRQTSRLIRRLRAGGSCLSSEVSTTDLDGGAACLSTREPTPVSGRVIHFGPFPMGAGESIRQVYQVAVGLDTRQGLYTNRAVLRDSAFALDLSNSDEVAVAVIPDPDLDQGILIGKVFCDHNSDGRQDEKEYGLGGAQVYLDNGTYAVTDATGKYHLQKINPGLHLLKIDRNSLPAGSRLTTDESRVVQFTRGLPAKINFGVSCRENWVEVQKVKLKPREKSPGQPKKQFVIPAISLAGDAKALRLSASGKVLSTLEVDLALKRGQRPHPLRPNWDQLSPPDLDLRSTPGLLFNCKVQGTPTIRGWRLSVWAVTSKGRSLIRRFSGMGSAPQQLLWDGTLASKPQLLRGTLYEAQLEVTAENGAGGSSPLRRFTVGMGRRRPPPPPAPIPSALINETAQPLDPHHRFAITVGRFPERPLQVELRRGDGKRVWLMIGPTERTRSTQDSTRVEIKGNLFAGKVQVNGHGVDTALLTIGLALASRGEQLPNLTPRGSLAAPAQFEATLPPALIKRWTLRISDSASNHTRTIEGSGPVPQPILWDGADDAGRGMVQPGGAYLALLSLEDSGGNMGRSPPLVLKAPGGKGFSAITIAGKKLFNPKDGSLTGPIKYRLLRELRSIKNRPDTERYQIQIQVAPPVTWEPERWAGLLEAVKQKMIPLLTKGDLPPARLELTVGAAPLPSTPVVPKQKGGPLAANQPKELITLLAVPPTPLVSRTVVPKVLVDGMPIKVNNEGAFSAQAKAAPGSLLVLELIDASDHRAQLLIPIKPRAPSPSSRIDSLTSARVASGGPDHVSRSVPGDSSGTYQLQMRGGGVQEVQLAQAPPYLPQNAKGPASQPASSQPVSSQPVSSRLTSSQPVSSHPTKISATPPRPFGAEVLHQAFKSQLTSSAKSKQPTDKPEAAQLAVDLPPRGALLKSHNLTLRGHTHPLNKVTVNGAAVRLAEDGTFTHTVKLPDGKSDLLIQSLDRAGNQGSIRWPVEVSDRELFLMAMAEGAIGQLGTELDGETDHSQLETGPLMLHGRAVLYLKGRIKGKYLFKQYFITAHVDTAKQSAFQEFFDQVIDPNRYYPVYGDSAQEVQDVNARDKYYLLIKADRSSVQMGNFTAGVKGIELLKYDRMLYGLKVDLDKTFFSNKLRQQAKLFVSRDDARLSRDHNVIRATGGSIYYLRHGEILAGSERINLVVRERDTGLVLTTLPQSRDLDYVIDYPGGRLLFKAPVPSVADASFSVNNPTFSTMTLAGHPIFLEIDYEYERDDEQGSGAWGAQIKDTLFDVLTIGGSYVQEDRSALAGQSYKLYGGEITLRHGKASAISAEFARSESTDAGNFISEDGGLTYLDMNHISQFSGDDQARDSNAYKINAELEFSDFLQKLRPETLQAKGYFARLDRGFFSGGTILDQGRTKFGGSMSWAITAKDRLILRHDGAIALLPQLPLPGSSLDPMAMREMETELSRLNYELRRGRLSLQGEYAYSFIRDPLLDGQDSHRHTLGAMGSYRLTKWLRISLGQEAILMASGNDPQLGSNALGLQVSSLGDWQNRMVTTVGAALTLHKSLELEVAEAVRWSGDNATSAGIKLKISDTASVYVRQQLASLEDRLITTSIVGAEDRFGADQSGRTYGEYQIESGVSGLLNRAILGLARKWTPWGGISFTGGYEHQQVFGGHLPDGTPTGDSQRDVVHLGAEYIRPRRFKLSTRAELRYDNGSGVIGLSPGASPGAVTAPNVDPRPGMDQGYADRIVTPGSQMMLAPGERWQVMSRSGASWQITRDLTFMGRFNIYHTYNRSEEKVEAQAIELGVGAALRPVAWDILNVLIKYTRLLEMRPISLTDDLAQWRTYDIFSIIPILELPWRLQLVEKFVYKQVSQQLDLLPGMTLDTMVQTLMWINRLNFHLTGQLDAGVEYRLMKMVFSDQGSQLKHGALVELGYWVHQYVRLGIGYNFSSFTDNEFADQDRDAKGFFFRVVGRY